jgi:acyl-CoA thioesterase FadM
MTLLQEVWRDEIKVFSMKVLLVYIERDRPRRIPKTFIEIFDTL